MKRMARLCIKCQEDGQSLHDSIFGCVDNRGYYLACSACPDNDCCCRLFFFLDGVFTSGFCPDCLAVLLEKRRCAKLKA